MVETLDRTQGGAGILDKAGATERTGEDALGNLLVEFGTERRAACMGQLKARKHLPGKFFLALFSLLRMVSSDDQLALTSLRCYVLVD